MRCVWFIAIAVVLNFFRLTAGLSDLANWTARKDDTPRTAAIRVFIAVILCIWGLSILVLS